MSQLVDVWVTLLFTLRGSWIAEISPLSSRGSILKRSSTNRCNQPVGVLYDQSVSLSE